MQLLADNDRGWVALDGNELIVGSKIDDPPKLRLTAPITEHGGGGGVVSFNRSRQAGVVCDGHQQDEMAMLRVEQAEDVRGDASNLKAEVNFIIEDGSGAKPDSMQKPLAFTWNVVTKCLLNLFGGGSDRFSSADGRFVTIQQGDGHLVQYDTRLGAVGDPAAAVWSSWSGLIKPLPW